MPIVCLLDRGCRRDLTYSGSSITIGITITPAGESGDGSQVSSDPHGTQCAGVLARTYKDSGGVAGSLQIMPVAIQDITGRESGCEVARAIKWATNHGAHIISISQTFSPTNFSSTDPMFRSNMNPHCNNHYLTDEQCINAEIQAAINKGVIICAATGNTKQPAIDYLANQPRVIAVGACKGDGQRVISAPIPNGNGATWGSNYGSQISVVALGVDVDTGLSSPLDKFYGTSAAAPQVAALAARILSVNPSLSNTGIRAIIERTADHPSGGRNNDVGYGHINALRALTLASKTVNAPLALSANHVAENAINGTFVGTVSATEPDVGGSLIHSLTDSAGDRFAIDSRTGALTVKNGSLLDFEVASSHNITIRVTDNGGLTFDKTFTITVTDVDEEQAGGDSTPPAPPVNVVVR